MKTTAFLTIFVLLGVLLSACSPPVEPGAPSSSITSAPAPKGESEAPASSASNPVSEPAALPCYFDQAADAAIAALGLTGTEDDLERVRLAFT